MTGYAVVKADGREYKVSEGDMVNVDYRREAKEGEKVSFSEVLLVSKEGKVTLGTPTVAGASVEAEVVKPLTKGPKIRGMKRVLRNSIRFKYGHRQKYTTVKITAIKEG